MVLQRQAFSMYTDVKREYRQRLAMSGAQVGRGPLPHPWNKLPGAPWERLPERV